jgi:hypothetical protein
VHGDAARARQVVAADHADLASVGAEDVLVEVPVQLAQRVGRRVVVGYARAAREPPHARLEPGVHVVAHVLLPVAGPGPAVGEAHGAGRGGRARLRG